MRIPFALVSSDEHFLISRRPTVEQGIESLEDLLFLGWLAAGIQRVSKSSFCETKFL